MRNCGALVISWSFGGRQHTLERVSDSRWRAMAEDTFLDPKWTGHARDCWVVVGWHWIVVHLGPFLSPQIHRLSGFLRFDDFPTEWPVYTWNTMCVVCFGNHWQRTAVYTASSWPLRVSDLTLLTL